MSNTERYTLTAVILHWFMAILILAMLGIGWYMGELPKGEQRTQLYALHKSVGLLLLGLICVRIIWRLMHTPPDLPHTMSPWMQLSAKLVHISLYILMLVQPLSGYLESAFGGYKVAFFGFVIPQWLGKNESLKEICEKVHEIAPIILAVIIAIHVLAALKHLVWDRDQVFRRILP